MAAKHEAKKKLPCPVDHLRLQAEARAIIDAWASAHGIPLTVPTRHQLARLLRKCRAREEPKSHSPKTPIEMIKTHAGALLKYRDTPPVRSDSIRKRCDRLLTLLGSTPAIAIRLVTAQVDGVALRERLERRDLAGADIALRQLLELPVEYGRGKRPLAFQTRLIRAVEAVAQVGGLPKPKWNSRNQTLGGPLADAIRELLLKARISSGDQAIYASMRHSPQKSSK